MFGINYPLIPKNLSGILMVIVIGRISTALQNIENIEASFRQVVEYVRSIYKGEIQFKFLGEQASGMIVDRPTIVEAEEIIAAGECDVVIFEDLSRLHRNPRYQYAFVQDCVDHDTRVIAIGDGLDTADPNWESALGTSALRHGLSNPDTIRRIRRTADYTFDNGGMHMKIPPGYVKLTKEQSASGEFGPKGLRIAKDPTATPHIQEVKRRLLSGYSPRSCAEYFNSEGVPTGPYAKRKTWNARLVRELFRNPLLHGLRQFREIKYSRNFGTGKALRRKNPEGPRTQFVPELAHITKEEQDRIADMLDSRRRDQQRTGKDSPRFGLPRRDALFPGQHARCAICGQLLYQTGAIMKCRGALPNSPEELSCWNHVHVKQQTVREKVLPRLLSELSQVDGFRKELIDRTWEAYRQRLQSRRHSASMLDERIASLDRDVARWTKVVRMAEDLEEPIRQLRAAERELKQARAEKATAESSAGSASLVYESREDIDANLEEVVMELGKSSMAFAASLRVLIPEFDIVPVQALDSNQVHPRARLAVRLESEPPPEVSDGSKDNPVATSEEIRFEVDLFDPPIHIRLLQDCVRAAEEHPDWTYAKIGALFGTSKTTVMRALKYSKLIADASLTEPYRVLTEKPESASRWRRRSPKRSATDSDESLGSKESASAIDMVGSAAC